MKLLLHVLSPPMPRAALVVLLVGLLVAASACDSSEEGNPEPEPEGWTRIEGVPAAPVDALYADAHTLYAGAGAVLYVSHDAGQQWTPSAPIPGAHEISVILEQEGRIFAGTFGGGVFESRDGGASWQARNGGLSEPGARTITAFAVRGESLYVATAGAAVHLLDLDGGEAWQPFRAGMPSEYAWNVSSLLLRGGLLLAGAGGNGHVYLNAQGEHAWREVQFAPFSGAPTIMLGLVDAGESVVGGGTTGLFRSDDGGATWASFDPDVGFIEEVEFALSGQTVYAVAAKTSRGSYLYASEDAGATWRLVEHLPGALTFDLAVHHGRLWAARHDGVWSLPLP